MPEEAPARGGGRYADIVDAIGHTPMVEIARMSPNPNVRILAKLEMANPTGSVKDRAAKYLIEDLERSGRLGPNSIILEPTSGNTGIALAMIGRRRGHAVTLVMPDNVTLERRQAVTLFGADVIDSPGELGSNGAIALAKKLAAEDPRYVMPYQYGNQANPLAHYETTGPEILADCPEIDVFVAGLGTGGTLMGVSRYLREHRPGIKVYAAEPLPGENVQGLRSLDEGFIPEIFDPSLIDGKFLVSNRDSIASLRDLIAKEGIFAGPSSGAVVVAAARVAKGMDQGTIVALLPDGGWKYLSAGTYARDLDEMEEDLEGGRELVVSPDSQATAGAAPENDHPGPNSVAIPVATVRAMIEQAQRDYPNETCGILSGTAPAESGGTVTTWFPARNEFASPLRFNIAPDDLLRIYKAIDAADEEVWAIVHSHVRSPAKPSPTDVGRATGWPSALWILVSLADLGADGTIPTDAELIVAPSPTVRVWRILDGRIWDVSLAVTG